MRRTSEPIAKIVELHFGKDVINNHFLSIIGYGSGVISQTKNEDEFLLNTIDLLIEVPNAEIFHKQWLKAKPKDYRGLSRWLGHPYLSLLMRWVFPIHFNHI